MFGNDMNIQEGICMEYNTPHRVSSLRHENAGVGHSTERSMDYLLSESHPNELLTTTISLASTGEKLHAIFLSSINLCLIIHIFLP